MVVCLVRVVVPLTGHWKLESGNDIAEFRGVEKIRSKRSAGHARNGLRPF